MFSKDRNQPSHFHDINISNADVVFMQHLKTYLIDLDYKFSSGIESAMQKVNHNNITSALLAVHEEVLSAWNTSYQLKDSLHTSSSKICEAVRIQIYGCLRQRLQPVLENILFITMRNATIEFDQTIATLVESQIYSPQLVTEISKITMMNYNLVADTICSQLNKIIRDIANSNNDVTTFSIIKQLTLNWIFGKKFNNFDANKYITDFKQELKNKCDSIRIKLYLEGIYNPFQRSGKIPPLQMGFHYFANPEQILSTSKELLYGDSLPSIISRRLIKFCGFQRYGAVPITGISSVLKPLGVEPLAGKRGKFSFFSLKQNWRK